MPARMPAKIIARVNKGELTAAQGLDREESVVGLYRSAGNTGILVCWCVYTRSLALGGHMLAQEVTY